MSKILHIKRHAESKLNKNKIIQGLGFDEGLSEEGVEKTKKMTEEVLVNKNYKKIITSPLLRTKETGEIINKSLELPISSDSRLVEFDSGILAGKSRDEIKEKYPDYYNIWMNRGDLDGIPGAETGDELQARVLLFLYDYLDKNNYSDLIISHAGFIRSMVNTILNKDRATPVDVNHEHLHEIKNVWKNIYTEKIFGGYNNSIIKVSTKNQEYIIRKNKKIDYFIFDSINKILKEINQKSDITNKLYQSHFNNEYGIQVMSFLEGEHVYGKLSNKQKKMLIKRVDELINIFKSIKIYNYNLPLLKDKLLSSVNKVNDKYIKNIGEKLLEDDNINMSDGRIIVHNDIHRGNLLFTEDDVKLIDFDGLLISKVEYQIASLLISFIFEGEKNINKLLSNFSIEYSIEKMLYYMKVRSYMGFVFFQKMKEREGKIDQKSQEIFDKYYNLFFNLKIIDNKIIIE